eukprot:m.1201273 g.1201273  ORF g.1201273 m.1201273 type:complete len:151 (+) comp24574_c0_seq70:2384-2836(+)
MHVWEIWIVLAYNMGLSLAHHAENVPVPLQRTATICPSVEPIASPRLRHRSSTDAGVNNGQSIGGHTPVGGAKTAPARANNVPVAARPRAKTTAATRPPSRPSKPPQVRCACGVLLVAWCLTTEISGGGVVSQCLDMPPVRERSHIDSMQ